MLVSIELPDVLELDDWSAALNSTTNRTLWVPPESRASNQVHNTKHTFYHEGEVKNQFKILKAVFVCRLQNFEMFRNRSNMGMDISIGIVTHELKITS